MVIIAFIGVVQDGEQAALDLGYTLHGWM